MSEYLNRLSQLLPTLCVDTSYEQGLLAASGTSGERLLVAGSQESQLFSLLATEEPLLEFGWTPFFPIEAEYGEAISIRVVNRAGEIERFHNTADFRQCCGSRLEELTACTVQLPDPLLKRCSLRFLMLNNTSFQMLNERAAGCTGCVIVIAADAGGFSEDYQTLCDWLADERCAADRVSLILTQRAPRLNPALEMMAETMLKREKISVFRCSLGRGSGLPPARALDHAVRDILDRSGAGRDDDGVIRTCCVRVEEKLRTALAEAEAAGEEAQRLETLFRDAEKNFHAIAETDRYSLSELLTQEEESGIRAEVRRMINALRMALPGLIDDAAAKSDDPKEDVKQLVGDYVSDLMDRFLTDLLLEVSEKLLIPRTQERFDQVIQRFRRLSRELQMEAFDDEAPVELDLLKSEGVNMGDYRTTVSEVLSRIIVEGGKMLVKLLAMVTLYDKLSAFGFVSLSNMLKKAGDAAASAMQRTIDNALPLRIYMNDLKKDLLENLGRAEGVLCEQLDESVFPRLYSMLDEQFRQMTQGYEAMIRGQGDRCAAQARSASDKAEQLQEQLRLVTELYSGATSGM